MTQTTLRFALALSLLAASPGCLEKKTSSGDASTAITKTPPSPAHKADTLFGDKLRLVGYDLSNETFRPGEADLVTFYWKVEAPIEKGWKLFTHVADPAGAVRANVDRESPIRRAKALSEWPVGSYVRDEVTVTLPEEWTGERATFLVGVYKGGERMQVKGGSIASGRRARAAVVPVRGGTRRDVPIPALDAPFADVAPKIDGVLDDAIWKRAKPTADLVNTMNGNAADFEANVRVAWNQEAVFFAWEVDDDLLKARATSHDDHLWKEDCVEIMVDPDGDGKNYFELQVSPRGVSFETRYDARRDPRPYGHVDWQSGIEAKAIAKGIVDDFDKDDGYTVEIRIPWTGFAHGTPPATPPKAGDVWRMNFYAMDEREKGQRSAGWSPPLVGDFHVPERFGRVAFIDGAR